MKPILGVDCLPLVCELRWVTQIFGKPPLSIASCNPRSLFLPKRSAIFFSIDIVYWFDDGNKLSGLSRAPYMPAATLHITRDLCNQPFDAAHSEDTLWLYWIEEDWIYFFWSIDILNGKKYIFSQPHCVNIVPDTCLMWRWLVKSGEVQQKLPGVCE